MNGYLHGYLAGAGAMLAAVLLVLAALRLTRNVGRLRAELRSEYGAPVVRHRASWRVRVRRTVAEALDNARRSSDDDVWGDAEVDDLPRDEQRVVGAHRPRLARRAAS